MKHLFAPLLLLQRFIVPAMVIVFVWAIWRTVFKKDMPVGLALYVSLVVLVDAFYNTGLYIPGLAQGSIKYSEICAGVLLFNRPPAPVLPFLAMRRAVLLFVGVYFGLMLVAALHSSPPLAGIFDFRKTAFPELVAFIVAVRGFQSQEDYRRFVLYLGVLALIIIAFSFWDVVFDRNLLHSSMLYKPEYFMNRRHQRFGGVFLNPNFMGAFVVLLFPIFFMTALRESQWRTRMYMIVLLLGLVFCLVQTQSRAPMLGFVGALVMLVLGPAGKISRTRRVIGLAVGVLALVLLMPGFFGRATGRFDAMEAETTTEGVSRATMWIYTEKLIALHPVLGVGFGEQQFLQAMDKTDFRIRFGRDSLDNPHNSYLEVAVFAGIPALVVFALANLMLLLSSAAVALRTRSPGHDTGLAFGMTAGIVGFLLSIYPDMQLFTYNVGPTYWLLFGLLLSNITLLSSGTLPKKSATAPVATPANGPAKPRRGGPLPLPLSTGGRH